jgi:phosphatidylserine decarboxylase
MTLREKILRRSPVFEREGRVTWIERSADRIGLNRWFLRRPPFSYGAQGDLIGSPAQAKIETISPIGPEGEIEEKKVLGQPRRFRISEILKDEKLSRTFLGGEFIKLYLAPWDLHFLLFPAPGRVVRYEYRSGWAVPLLFCKRGDVLNQRLSILLETDWGFPMAIVLIGSWMVNGIHHSFQVGRHCEAGDDLGYFKVGSSVVMAFPPGAIEWVSRTGAKASLGSPLARVTAAKPT